jgi:hypothetical protein
MTIALKNHGMDQAESLRGINALMETYGWPLTRLWLPVVEQRRRA